MDFERIPSQPPRPHGWLRGMRAGQTEELPVTWFGLVCDDGPVLNIGLCQGVVGNMPKSGEALFFRLGKVELVGKVVDCSKFFGRVLVRLRLLHAVVDGRRLAAGQLHEFCCRDGWRRWLAQRKDSAQTA